MFEGTCTTCGARLSFLPTKNGKQMPCEHAPIPLSSVVAGKRYAVVEPDGCVITGGDTILGLVMGFDYALRIYEPHWGNCNAPDKHRRSKR